MVVEPYWLGSPSAPLIRPKSDSTSRYFDHRSGRAVQAPLTRAFTPLGATSGVDRNRQPRSPRLVFALGRLSCEKPLRDAPEAAVHTTREIRQAGSREHTPRGRALDVARYRSTATEASEPKPTGNRRVCRADKPSEKSRSSHRPHPGPNPDRPKPLEGQTPATSTISPANRSDRKEMTSDAALTERHLLANERSAEFAAAARSPLRRGTREGLSASPSEPDAQETPLLPRTRIARLTASGRLSAPAFADSVSTVQRLRAAASSRQLTSPTSR